MGVVSEQLQQFKALDNARTTRTLSGAEEQRWRELKDAIEAATSNADCPPSSQRAAIRVPVSYEASFRDAAGFRNAYLRNISEGGVYIASGNTFGMGDRFVLFLVLENPPVVIEQRVQVVWVNANPTPGTGLEPGVGVAFLDIEPATKARIKAIVHNRLDELIEPQ